MNAYRSWLLSHCKGMSMKDKIQVLSTLIYKECSKGNRMAFDILDETGDKTYNYNTFVMAAKIVLQESV